MPSEMNWVVVGLGMGQVHARQIAATGGLRLHGVCDLREELRNQALAEHPGIQAYTSYEEVLADPAVHGVTVVTPHNTHAQMAIQAMDARKHAITDKAMCLTVTEAREMIAARDRNGVLLSVYHNRRWDREFMTVRKLVEDGKVGRPYHIQSCVTEWGKVGGWRSERGAMGGWLYDWGAHTLDQILLLAGSRPKSVYAFIHYRHDAPSTVEDYVNCTVTFESGLTATTVVGYINRIPMPRWYLIGDAGALQAWDFSQDIWVRSDVGGEQKEWNEPLVAGDWSEYYANIAAVLAGGADLIVGPEDLVPQIAIAEAAYKSVASGQVEVVRT